MRSRGLTGIRGGSKDREEFQLVIGMLEKAEQTPEKNPWDLAGDWTQVFRLPVGYSNHWATRTLAEESWYTTAFTQFSNYNIEVLGSTVVKDPQAL